METLLEYSKSRLGRVEIEIGCGPHKPDGRIGIDRLPLPGVDVVMDLEQGLGVFPNHCADIIHARSVFEHVTNLGRLMRDVHRVLKPDGRLLVFVPHFSNPYFYSDYTHRTFFGLYTFYYFVDPNQQLRRKVPAFYENVRFVVESMRLTFAGTGSLGRLFGGAAEALVNVSPRMQEFYEAHLCYLLPCYAIDAVLRPAPDPQTSGREVPLSAPPRQRG